MPAFEVKLVAAIAVLFSVTLNLTRKREYWRS